MNKRCLARTDVKLSALALGTVKFGRNQSVKYPTAFDLPSDSDIKNLLALARASGITTLDTAAAYGLAEERLGQLLTDRHDWEIITKAGEEYDSRNDQSRYCYAPKQLEKTLENSLKKLRADYVDCWMLHSDGNDVANLTDEVIETFIRARQRGLVRSIGVSTKTVEGGSYALQYFDCIMMSISLSNTGESTLLDTARKLDKSVILKKIYDSGWALSGTNKEQVMQKTMHTVFQHPAVCSVVIGTINPAHLQENIDVWHTAVANQSADTP